jgi:hypothetical protein
MDDDHKSNFTDADRTKIQASRRRPLARFPKREIKADISSFLARHSAIVRACGFAVWPDLPVFIFPHIIDQGDKGRFGLAFQDAQGTHFITKQRMCGRFSALGSTDVQVRSFKFHVGPLQLSEFTGPQPMAEANQDHSAVSGAMAVALGRFDQLLNFALCEMFAGVVTQRLVAAAA